MRLGTILLLAVSVSWAFSKLPNCRPCIGKYLRKVIGTSLETLEGNKRKRVNLPKYVPGRSNQDMFEMQVVLIDYFDPRMYICCKCFPRLVEDGATSWIIARNQKRRMLLVIGGDPCFPASFSIGDGSIVYGTYNEISGEMDFFYPGKDNGEYILLFSSYGPNGISYMGRPILNAWMGLGYRIECLDVYDTLADEILSIEHGLRRDTVYSLFGLPAAPDAARNKDGTFKVPRPEGPFFAYNPYPPTTVYDLNPFGKDLRRIRYVRE